MGFKFRQTYRPLPPRATICILTLLSSKGGGCSSAGGGHDHQQPPGSSPSPKKEHLSPTSCRFNAPRGGGWLRHPPLQGLWPGRQRHEREDSPTQGPHGWSRGPKGSCTKEEEAGRRRSDPGCKLSVDPAACGGATWEGSVISRMSPPGCPGCVPLPLGSTKCPRLPFTSLSQSALETQSPVPRGDNS